MPGLRLLLINPWIHDFAAYDLWMKPLGLLRMGASFREHGCEVFYIDCMDRYHPDVRETSNSSEARQHDGRGKYPRTILKKPDTLADVPRRFARYGISPGSLWRDLKRVPAPDAVLVTSGMTYWYTGLRETISYIHARFPDVPVITGGTYAALMPGHAAEHSGADFVFAGGSLKSAIRFVEDVLGRTVVKSWGSFEEFPVPAFDLCRELRYVPLCTSYGCPYTCSFCASRLLYPEFVELTPADIMRHVSHWLPRGIRHFVFYDDALFVNWEKRIGRVLEEIAREARGISFHTPNGVHPRFVDARLARLLKRSGFKTLRLSFETVHPGRQESMGKVSSAELETAIRLLREAGYHPWEIEVYILMGLPQQPFSEVLDSAHFVSSLGCQIRLACWSPIPGTGEWKRAVAQGCLDPDSDPLRHNESCYPMASSAEEFAEYHRIRSYVKNMNKALVSGL